MRSISRPKRFPRYKVGHIRMADRESYVYQAKLAEQAERYDGELPRDVQG